MAGESKSIGQRVDQPQTEVVLGVVFQALEEGFNLIFFRCAAESMPQAFLCE